MVRIDYGLVLVSTRALEKDEQVKDDGHLVKTDIKKIVADYNDLEMVA